MKKIGIVGGVAWPSTVDYYSEICRLSEERHRAGDGKGPSPMPEMSIESLDLRKVFGCIGVDGHDASWSEFDEYHRVALQRVEASGSHFALIASNTPHHRFDSIVRGIGIPVIHIWEEAAKECARLEASQVLVLGTPVTMGSQEFQRRFAKRDMRAAGPQEAVVRTQTADLIAELQSGRIEGVADQIGKIAKSSFDWQFGARPVVCLACTELPLAFPEWKTLASFSAGGITYVNSSAAHIGAAFDCAVAE